MEECAQIEQTTGFEQPLSELATSSTLESYQSCLDRINSVLEQSTAITNSILFGDSPFSSEESYSTYSSFNPLSPYQQLDHHYLIDQSTITTTTTQNVDMSPIASIQIPSQQQNCLLPIIVEETHSEDDEEAINNSETIYTNISQVICEQKEEQGIEVNDDEEEDATNQSNSSSSQVISCVKHISRASTNVASTDFLEPSTSAMTPVENQYSNPSMQPQELLLLLALPQQQQNHSRCNSITGEVSQQKQQQLEPFNQRKQLENLLNNRKLIEIYNSAEKLNSEQQLLVLPKNAESHQNSYYYLSKRFNNTNLQPRQPKKDSSNSSQSEKQSLITNPNLSKESIKNFLSTSNNSTLSPSQKSQHKQNNLNIPKLSQQTSFNLKKSLHSPQVTPIESDNRFKQLNELQQAKAKAETMKYLNIIVSNRKTPTSNKSSKNNNSSSSQIDLKSQSIEGNQSINKSYNPLKYSQLNNSLFSKRVSARIDTSNVSNIDVISSAEVEEDYILSNNYLSINSAQNSKRSFLNSQEIDSPFRSPKPSQQSFYSQLNSLQPGENTNNLSNCKVPTSKTTNQISQQQQPRRPTSNLSSKKPSEHSSVSQFKKKKSDDIKIPCQQPLDIKQILKITAELKSKLQQNEVQARVKSPKILKFSDDNIRNIKTNKGISKPNSALSQYRLDIKKYSQEFQYSTN